MKTNLEKLTRPELSARYKANVSERKRLSDENKVLVELWKKLGKPKAKKTVKTAAKPRAKRLAKKK